MLVYIDNQSIGKDVWFDNLNIENYESEVLEEDHYWPFGLTMNTTPLQLGVNPQPYKLTTKELESNFALNIYDFGARTYDPAAPHWWQVDPLSEKAYYESPYCYVGNNPVRFVDFDGRLKFDKSGNIISVNVGKPVQVQLHLAQLPPYNLLLYMLMTEQKYKRLRTFLVMQVGIQIAMVLPLPKDKFG